MYQYDALNRLLSTDYLETPGVTDITFAYDTRPGSGVTQPGRLREVVYQQAGVTVTRSMDYDAWGNVTWQRQAIPGYPAAVMGYAYDGNDQLLEITYPSGRVVAYTRHPNGQIASITATFNGVTTPVIALALHHPFGPPLALGYGNGLTQLRGITTAGLPSYVQTFDASGSYDYRSYSLSSAGNITQITDHVQGAQTRSYGYDDLDRLTWDSRISASPTYSYDGNGNRLTRTQGTGFPAQNFSYHPGTNRHTTYAYDGMGNQTETGQALLAYDPGGRLDRVTVYQGERTLDYNGLGELARMASYYLDPCQAEPVLLAQDFYQFLPDGRALTLTTFNLSTVSTDYVWLDGLPVAQFQDSYDAEGVYMGTELTYLHPDHQDRTPHWCVLH